MRVGIYATDGFAGSQAFAQGLQSIGCTGVVRSLSDYGAGCLETDFRAVAIFGLQHKGRRILDEYLAAQIPAVVIDYGYLKRTNHAHDWKTGHWQISVGGLNRLPDDVDGSRFDALGLTIQERGGNPGGYVLLAVQTPGDATHGMDEVELGRWCKAMADRWPGLMIRPHPLAADLDYGLPRCPAETLTEAMAGARLVVTGNSNTGNDALMAGVPVVGTVPGAAWESLSGETLPSLTQRRAHFNRCAWGQWTWDEFRAGLPQRFLQERGTL